MDQEAKGPKAQPSNIHKKLKKTRTEKTPKYKHNDKTNNEHGHKDTQIHNKAQTYKQNNTKSKNTGANTHKYT